MGKGLIEKLNGKTLYAEQTYPTNFTVTGKTFCLSLHYDGDISRLFVNGKKQVAFTAKDSEIKPYKMSLEIYLQILVQQTYKKQDYMVMFMILVLSMESFKTLKYKIFMLI